MKTITRLVPGQSAQVLRVHGADALQLRLMEMGFTAGTQVQLHKAAPFGGPLALRLRGYSLSLRRTEADFIEIL